jgi:hypothetical protein
VKSRGKEFFYLEYSCLEASEMTHLDNSKNNNSIATAATFLTLATITIILGASSAVIVVPLSLQSAEAAVTVCRGSHACDSDAPTVVTGDNIYIAWWTNNTENGNEEVMFRASTDGGTTFSDKINLSNTTDSDSWRVEIAGEGETVVVSWWETNQTSDIPVARISTDAGETFGPLLMLGSNGTLGSTEDEITTSAIAEGVGEEGEAQ